MVLFINTINFIIVINCSDVIDICIIIFSASLIKEKAAFFFRDYEANHAENNGILRTGYEQELNRSALETSGEEVMEGSAHDDAVDNIDIIFVIDVIDAIDIV